MKLPENLETGDPVSCHASHEACELKCELYNAKKAVGEGHASHEACELKFQAVVCLRLRNRHASHEACELKCTHVLIELSICASRLA